MQQSNYRFLLVANVHLSALMNDKGYRFVHKMLNNTQLNTDTIIFTLIIDNI